MIPNQTSNSKSYSSSDEYTSQGQIVQEMRQASRKYGVPILTITQNNRTAENFMVEMSNNLIGDSIKKIRYADGITMIRQREDLDVFNPDVAKDVNLDNAVSINDSSADYLKYITPFEAKITKAKDGDKSKTKFHLFSKKSLRICETVSEYIEDYNECVKKSNDLLNSLSIIGLTEADIEKDIVFNENDPFDNLII